MIGQSATVDPAGIDPGPQRRIASLRVLKFQGRYRQYRPVQ